MKEDEKDTPRRREVSSGSTCGTAVGHSLGTMVTLREGSSPTDWVMTDS